MLEITQYTRRWLRRALPLLLLFPAFSAAATDYPHPRWFYIEVSERHFDHFRLDECISHQELYLLSWISDREWAQVRSTENCYLTKGGYHEVTYKIPVDEQVVEMCHTHPTTGAWPSDTDLSNCQSERDYNPDLKCCVISARDEFDIAWY